MRRDPQRCFGTDNEPLGQYQGLRNNHSEHPPVFSRAAQLVYMEHTGKPSGRLSALFIFMAVDSTGKLSTHRLQH